DGCCGATDSDPTWSPDGQQLAFASTRPTNAAWHIWIANADASGLHQLTGDFSTQPTWSPDGTRVAYTSGMTGSISVVGVDGAGAHQVTHPPANWYDEGADWSPDGGTLVFTRRDLDTTVSDL